MTKNKKTFIILGAIAVIGAGVYAWSQLSSDPGQMEIETPPRQYVYGNVKYDCYPGIYYKRGELKTLSRQEQSCVYFGFGRRKPLTQEDLRKINEKYEKSGGRPARHINSKEIKNGLD